VLRGHYHVGRRHTVTQHGSEGGAHEPDAGAEPADVDPPEALAEDLDLTPARMEVEPGDPHQRGLPRAVGAEHYPPLVRRHLPVDVVEDGDVVTYEPNLRQAQRRRHVAGP
jgi:hypothetical protein